MSKYNLIKYSDYFYKFAAERGVYIDAKSNIYGDNSAINNAILLGLYITHIKKDEATVGLYVNSNKNSVFSDKKIDYSIVIETGKTSSYITTFIDTANLQPDNVVSSFITQYLHKCGGNDYVKVAKKVTEEGLTQIYILSSRNLNLDFSKVIISLLPRLLPGMFTQNELKGMVGIFKDILDLSVSGQTMVDSIFKKLCISFDELEREQLFEGMRNSMKYAHTNRHKNLEKKITQCRKECEGLMNEYRSMINKLNDLLESYNLYDDSSLDETVNMLFEYMRSNPKICDLDTVDNKLIYNVKSDLMYFDEDMYYAHVHNKSWLGYDNLKLDKEKLIRALDAIFIDRKYHLPTYASFELRFDNVSGIDVIKNRPVNFNGKIMKSPHSMIYNCYGGFYPLWNEALENGNFITAIETTIRLTENINWSDSVVAKELIKDLLFDDLILDKAGNRYTLTQIMEVEG